VSYARSFCNLEFQILSDFSFQCLLLLKILSFFEFSKVKNAESFFRCHCCVRFATVRCIVTNLKLQLLLLKLFDHQDEHKSVSIKARRSIVEYRNAHVTIR
jgi:hypothetical protein